MEELFGTQDHVTTVQMAARTVLIFFYGLVLVRLFGRRMFGKWSALDVIVSLIVGSGLSRALTGSAPLWETLLAMALLMLLHWVLSHGAARFATLSRLFEGTEAVLGRDGGVDGRALKRHAVSGTDLVEALRQSGLDDASQARLIVLEPSGKITVLKKD
jgi:uncharacterized membrane protein YcaP (DUF421 family)